MKSIHKIGGWHCHRAGGENKRKSAHILCLKMIVNSPREKILIVPVHQHGRHDVTTKPSIDWVLTICEADVRGTQVGLKNTPVSLNSTQVSLSGSPVSLMVSIYVGGCSCLFAVAAPAFVFLHF